MEKAMNLSLTTPATSRSESLAFLSLSANDIDCIEKNLRTHKSTRNAEHCANLKVTKPTQHDEATVALCDLIKTLSESKSADEFVARRERLFARYCDLMLGLGRIVHALTDIGELIRRVKAQLATAEKFFSEASEQFCPVYLKDQALFSLWELGKVVDLADFIHSRPPLPESKREEDMRLSGICTTELLFGRIHLDCLNYAILAKHLHSEEIREMLSEGMRHFVNGHIAIRFGARLRQEAIDDAPVELIPLDNEDRQHLAYSMAGQDDEEY
jgi:hypothetical protein